MRNIRNVRMEDSKENGKYSVFVVIVLYTFLTIFLNMCSQQPERIQRIVSDTNTFNIRETNTIFITNGSESLGMITLYISDSEVVQPIYRLYGKVSQPVLSLSAYVSNISTTFLPVFTSSTDFYVPIVITNSSIAYVLVSAISSNSNIYTVGLNLLLSNVPFTSITNVSTNFLITPTNIVLSGIAEISDPAEIVNIYIIVSNSSGITTNIANTNSGVSWTNLVHNVMFSSNVSLDGGFNYIRVLSVSSEGIQYETPVITVLKSLFLVDGIFDSTWNSVSTLATTDVTNSYLGYGLGSLRITNDSFFLYIFVSNLNVPNLGANGLKLTLAIDTNSPSGASNDAWIATSSPGRFVFSPTNGNLPDIEVQIRLKNSNEINGAAIYSAINGTNAWTNLANTWTTGYDRGCLFGVDNSIGWEIAIPLSLVNLSNGMMIYSVVILGRPNGDDRNSALFVLPVSPSNEITTNDGYYTNHVSVYATNYTIFLVR